MDFRADSFIYKFHPGRQILPCSSDLSGPDQAGEMLKGAIIGLLCFSRKTASRQLPALEMVLNAFAADARSGTTAVAAGTLLFILFAFAFH